jgi:hypothetical protein
MLLVPELSAGTSNISNRRYRVSFVYTFQVWKGQTRNSQFDMPLQYIPDISQITLCGSQACSISGLKCIEVPD